MSARKLLAPKALRLFEPSEFKSYVKSLYFRKAKKTPSIRLKKQKPPYSWKLTPKGKLAVTVNRSPKWISREELAQIAKESGFAENIVWTTVLHTKKKKQENVVRLSTQAEEDSIKAFNEEFPW